MKKDYQTLTTLTLGQKKNYLIKICNDQKVLDCIYDCMTNKALKELLQQVDVYQQLFINALTYLYQSSDYEQLEFHLMMMNAFFHNQDYIHIKKELFIKLCKKTVTIHEYCVLRHLIDFQNISFAEFIKVLYRQYHVEIQECAKICLLEDQYHLAYLYLKQLPDCQDEKILDLLCSYSVIDYMSLLRHYHKKRSDYQLAPSH